MFNEFTFQLASFMCEPRFADDGAGPFAARERDDDFRSSCNHPFELDDSDSWFCATKEQTLP